MHPPTARPAGRPFALDAADAYRRWRDAKLAGYPRRVEDLVVELRDPRAPSAAEVAELTRVCRAANMAIYAGPAVGAGDKDIPRRLGAHLGLARLDANMLADDDGISSLSVAPGKAARGYIPYSNQRLLWHTDGYYNPPARRIRAFILHCAQPAADGGENGLLDHEIAYILLRDADPDYIEALSAPDAMTIPANTEEGAETRPAQTGPVFSVDADTGGLHMRYTARTRSIEWKPDGMTRAAVQFLEQLLAGDSPYVFRHRLAAGQGLVCNNVLHNRSAFQDDGARQRLLYRARYYDRIIGTDSHVDS
ncbi:MAG: TauD/TfdA family dioxygenase [Gammaproteobacteria bacterium]|nr:TauD/TfdA family dioxygenase [Gammaproteobacteria bacterium]